MLDEDIADLFMHAAKSGDIETAERFLRRRSDLVNYTNRDRETPLHLAVQNGQYEMVRTLMAYGANPNAPDRRGRTPLQLAQQANHADLVRVLSARP